MLQRLSNALAGSSSNTPRLLNRAKNALSTNRKVLQLDPANAFPVLESLRKGVFFFYFTAVPIQENASTTNWRLLVPILRAKQHQKIACSCVFATEKKWQCF